MALAIKIGKQLKPVDDMDDDEQHAMESPLPTDGLYMFTKSKLDSATNGYSDDLVLGDLVLGEGEAGKVRRAASCSQKNKIKEKSS